MRNRRTRTTADRIKSLKLTIEDYKKCGGNYLKFIPELKKQLVKLENE